MYKKFIISFVIIALIVGCFIAVWANKKEPTQEEKLKLKLNEEIEYLSSSIISIANNLNNIKIEDYKVTEKGNEKQIMKIVIILSKKKINLLVKKVKGRVQMRVAKMKVLLKNKVVLQILHKKKQK